MAGLTVIILEPELLKSTASSTTMSLATTAAPTLSPMLDSKLLLLGVPAGLLSLASLQRTWCLRSSSSVKRCGLSKDRPNVAAGARIPIPTLRSTAVDTTLEPEDTASDVMAASEGKYFQAPSASASGRWAP